MNEFEKMQTLMNMKQGTIIEIMDRGTPKKAEFIRMKRKNFVANMDDGTYNIPISLFSKVIEEAKEVSKSDIMDEIALLKVGDAFYITNGQRSDALLFTYDSMRDGRIIGINPITKQRSRIDVSLYKGKVADI